MSGQAPQAHARLDDGMMACGDLVLLIRSHIQALPSGHVLHVVAYDRGALEDVPAWCRKTGNPLLHQIADGAGSQPSHFYIQKGHAAHG